MRWSFFEFTLNIRVFCGVSRYFWCKRGDRNPRKLERRSNIYVLKPVEVEWFYSEPMEVERSSDIFVRKPFFSVTLLEASAQKPGITVTERPFRSAFR